MKYTWTPHAKACAQVGAPLLVAAAGLTLAAIVCRDATPALRPDVGAAHEMANAVEAGFAIRTPASGPAIVDTGPPAGSTAGAPAKAHDLACLSEAVYFEARGESSAGQAAVAQVVLNRARNPAYPKSVCAVVFQSASHGGCQFSFVCDGAMARPLEPVAWRRARMVATRALEGYVMTAVGRALNFHTVDVAPAGAGTAVARLGGHVFLIPGAHSAAHAPARHEASEEPQTAPSDASSVHEAARDLTIALGDVALLQKADAATARGGED